MVSTLPIFYEKNKKTCRPADEGPPNHLEDHRGHVYKYDISMLSENGKRKKKGRTGTETGIVEKTIRSTKRCDGNILIPEILLGDALNLFGGDGIDVSLDFAGGVSFAGGDQLSANLPRQVSQVKVRKEKGKRRTSSAMAVVPSRPNNKEALS